MKLVSQYKGLRRENYILCFGRLVTAMGAMIWPMLTMILSRKMGMSAEHIAWVMAAVGILALPASLIGGKMADHFNKKMNIVYLDIVSVVCYIVCAVIPLSAKTIVLMFVAATCQNMEHPSYNALTADITVTEDRERAYSLQYLCMNLGFVMSPTIAGYLLRDYLWLAFLISGAAIGCSVVLIFFMVKDITPVEDTSRKAVYQTERGGRAVDSPEGESDDCPLSADSQRLLCILSDVQLSDAVRFGETAWGQRGGHLRLCHQCELCGSRDIYAAVYQNVPPGHRDGQDDAGADSSDGGIWIIPAVPWTDTFLLCRYSDSDLG
ncbi:MAG: MFS transporter [Lachnospiraceae bacterium]